MVEVSKIGVIGLGYVGLPLAKLFLQTGHTVYGVDIDENKIQALINHKSYLSDFTNAAVKKMFAGGKFIVSQSFDKVAEVDAVIICVPTPLDKHSQPDLSYVKNAIQNALPYMRPGQLVVLESSTYPGTTEEELQPLIESTGLQVGRDVSLAYSPERIDPGQNSVDLQKIPKVVGGVTPACTKFAQKVYESIFEQVVVVSSPRAAEMTKIVENSQRFVNISFMNELAMLCDEMKIDLWEVIAAASTKPYGFVPYFPGPGVGGHCIPVDPMYLLWKAKTYDFDLRFIELAHKINELMPNFVIKKVVKSLPKPIHESKILVIGVTYKKDVNDMRESRALAIVEGLVTLGAQVNFYDPYIDQIKVNNTVLKSLSLTKRKVQMHDCTLILTDHSGIPYEAVVDAAPLVIDTRNATCQFENRGNIILL